MCQVDPLDDIDVINLELALADLAQIEKRMDRLKKGESRITRHIAASSLLVGSATRITETCPRADSSPVSQGSAL